ncbi:MAG: catalase, partial [Cyanobacteria bacterium J06621_12]
VMTDEQAQNFQWNPFDLTKVWPHADYPLQTVGRFELNRNPENYFAEVEQAAFSPGNVVPGISWSPDRMLQARIMSYADAHRHRLSVNYDTIPVNKPHATEANDPYRDGLMRTDDNKGSKVNYNPSHEGYPQASKRAEEPGYSVSGMAARIELDDDDHYDQARMYYDMLNNEEKERLYQNIAGSLGKTSPEVIKDQMQLFSNVCSELAEKVQSAISDTEPAKPEPKPARV